MMSIVKKKQIFNRNNFNDYENAQQKKATTYKYHYRETLMLCNGEIQLL